MDMFDMSTRSWGAARGIVSEARVFIALSELRNPPTWYLGVRAPTPYQDAMGVDLIAYIRSRREPSAPFGVPIQVKSSHAGADKFYREKKERWFERIPVIVVMDYETNKQLSTRILGILEEVRSGGYTYCRYFRIIDD